MIVMVIVIQVLGDWNIHFATLWDPMCCCSTFLESNIIHSSYFGRSMSSHFCEFGHLPGLCTSSFDCLRRIHGLVGIYIVLCVCDGGEEKQASRSVLSFLPVLGVKSLILYF
jgi:hypothetical protein